jgi:CheY-like chemotaxis protein
MNVKDEKQDFPRPKLLLVEDDKVTVNIIIRILINKYDIDYAPTAKDALQKAMDNSYDAFLIDIGLPGKMNGAEATKKLKEIKDNNHKPYIAITAYAMAGDKERLLSEGLTHYISKPFNFIELSKLIETAIKEKN